MIKNNYYELMYDDRKNRIYFKVKGYWPSVDVVPDYIKDWDGILSKAKSGATVLSDLSDMKSPPEDVKAIHEKAQKMVVDKGVKKVADMSSSAVTKLSVDRISNASGMITIRRFFPDVKSAESWLNE